MNYIDLDILKMIWFEENEFIKVDLVICVRYFDY